MKHSFVWAVVCLLAGMFSQSLAAQVPAEASEPVFAAESPQASVLRIIRFSGTVPGGQGHVPAGPVGVTFALYAEQEGGAPLWLETQNVDLDEQRRYTALLGSTSNEGLPLELFTSGEARWLGIQVQGQPEQPRILLVSVPYALRAEEALRLAGREASDYLLAEQMESDVQQVVETKVVEEMEAQGLVSTEDGVTKTITDGASTFTDNNTTQVVQVTQNGTGRAVDATSTTGNTIEAESTGTSGTNFTLLGINRSTGGRALFGYAAATSGNTIAAAGRADSPNGIGFFGQALATTGPTVGVQAEVRSASGTAGVLANTAGGKLLSGKSSGTEVFSVDGSGGGFFSGNVGIGTSTPSARLDVVGGANFTSSLQVNDTGGLAILGSTSNAGANASGVRGFATAATGNTIGVWGNVTSGDGVAGLFDVDLTTPGLILEGRKGGVTKFTLDGDGNLVASGNIGTNTTSGNLVIAGTGNSSIAGGLLVDSTTLMVDASNNRVGIGTASPGFRLTLDGSGNEVYSVMSEDGTDSVDNFKFQIAPGSGTSSTRVGHFLGRFGTVFNIANLASAPLAFGVGAGPTERMRIDASGNVGIGTTSPQDLLHVNGIVRLISVNDLSGSCILNCVSDARLKKNIEPLRPVLDRLVMLEPVHFYWRAEEYPELHLGTGRNTGLVAQQVQQALPELAGVREDGFKTVKYHELPVLLLQAIKEQQAHIRALEAELETVKAQLSRSDDNQVAALNLQE